MTRRLSEEALLTALHAWHLSSPRLVRRLPDGFTSEVWLVEAEEAYVVSQPGFAELIHRACTAAREFEARREVTGGVIWADRVEIVLEKETGRVGVIDWGAIERGPLLFDVALALLWLFPKGSQASEEFLHTYLAAAPVRSDELEGLPYYTALL